MAKKVKGTKTEDGRDAVVIEVGGAETKISLKEADQLHRDLKQFRRKRRATKGPHSLKGKVCPVCAARGIVTPINDRAKVCPGCRPVGAKRR